MIKKIFGILIKVPCYIMISYLVINIVMFAMFYFRALGVSYAVMETAVENNFIPNSEARALYTSLNDITSANADGSSEMRTPIAGNFGIIIDTYSVKSADSLYNLNTQVDGTTGITNSSTNKRRQYGNDMIVGVGYTYTAVLPMNRQSGSKNTGDAINWVDKVTSAPITIAYKVPGLKYYPDL